MWGTYMFNVDFSFVHKLHKAFNVNILNILHYKDGILFFVLWENAFEVGTASREHYFVGLYCSAFTGQSHITKGLPVQELREHCLEVRMMVPPSEAILLRKHFAAVFLCCTIPRKIRTDHICKVRNPGESAVSRTWKRIKNNQ